MQKSAKCRRRIAVINGLVALVTCLLLACAPAPAPTPSPTPAFASEEAAFEAAEEVYRAYNDAGNARRLDRTGANPQQYLVGAALEADIEAQRLLSASDVRIEGEASVISASGRSAKFEGQQATLVLVLCLDVSRVSVRNEDGADVTPAERGDLVAQEVTFIGTKQSLLIANEASLDVSTC